MTDTKAKFTKRKVKGKVHVTGFVTKLEWTNFEIAVMAPTRSVLKRVINDYFPSLPYSPKLVREYRVTKVSRVRS